MSDQDRRIAEIQGRVDKATQGPWEPYSRNSGIERFDHDNDFLGWEIIGPPNAARGQFERGHDANFIANAPDDVRWLLERDAAMKEKLIRLMEDIEYNIAEGVYYQELRVKLAAKDQRIEQLEARLARYDQTIEDIVTGGTDG